MTNETKEAMQEFVDALETEYGDCIGVELIFEHPIVEGERQDFADIKEAYVYRVHKENIL